MADSAGAMQRRGLVDGPDFEFFQRRYFTPAEVAEHNLPEDLWVSYLGSVYDLSPLAQEHKGDLLLKPIIEVAGQDISHWFDPKTRDIRKHVDPLTGTLRYRTPRGRFLHVPPQLPRSDWANDFGKPWWQGTRYEVGRLSAKTRSIRIINTLTSQEHTLEGWAYREEAGKSLETGPTVGSKRSCKQSSPPSELHAVRTSGRRILSPSIPLSESLCSEKWPMVNVIG
ncbi:cytochrome b5 domain-containing protein 1 isoform 2-T3 [Lycaon pictus]